MTLPQRPEPAPTTALARLQLWAEELRGRWQLRSPFGSESAEAELPLPADRAFDFGPPERSLGLWTGVIALGAALIAVGALWGWQSWSQRSAPPIDDLLPRFDTTEQDAVTDASEQPAPNPVVPAPIAESSVPDPAVEAPPASQIIVHVSGSVASPGIVTLDAGARVFEAIEAAGGGTRGADLDRVNLAAPAGDGERIHVPALGESEPPQVVAPFRSIIPEDTAGSDDSAAPVDINTASPDQLESLPGIGPSTAKAIVQTREDRGPFLVVEELLEVPGIGSAKLAQLSPFVSVG